MDRAPGGLTRRTIAVALSLFFLNASVTFVNVWPTPAVRWRGELSIELAVSVLLAAGLTRCGSVPASNVAAFLSAVWILLVLGRYADTTAPALYGRDVNLYWDLRLIPDVAAMAARVAPLWLLVVSAIAAAAILAVLFLVVRLAWRSILRCGLQVADSRLDDESAIRFRRDASVLRRVLVALSGAALIGAAAERLAGKPAEHTMFAAPVTLMYARQVQFLLDAWSAASPLAGSPPMDSDLAQVRDADVLLVFVESYGAVSFERQDIAQPLAGVRARLEQAVRDGGRSAVSAFVESPTFGGSSWLAHVSLMSGVEVRDARTNARLMTEHRDTLVRLFARRGFRTVALMPGLRQRWPEGVFYGFDEIYGADRLAYRGPEFGWFAIPDQFSLDRLAAVELRRSPRPPLFVFFPTLSTHFPFNPTPPYQPEWGRMTSDRPFDGPAIVRAYARQPDWINFTPGYVDALSYELETFAGYLERQADRELVMILLGDHQPPALVSGEGATWNVPVHIITSRPGILDRLITLGFRRGLIPEPPALGRMHALLPILLDAFGSHESGSRSEIRGR